MPNYKISVSKDGRKYNIVFKADDETSARNRVHKEGYSILGIEELANKHVVGNTFIFEGYKNGEFKHGKIVGNDIFKVYIKLRKDLEYDVKYIYGENDENINQEKKEKIIKELSQEFDLYFKGGKKEKIDELREKIKNERKSNDKLENFYLKKELEDVNKLLEIVLNKLELIITGKYPIEIDLTLKDKFKNIYNEIIKLKKSTNISKLKEIGELALLKIGKLELQELEKNKNTETRELLKDTNKLLKKIGSKDQFIEKNKDINYQFNNFLFFLKNKIANLKSDKKKDDGVDKDSYSYIKTSLYLLKYRERLKENNLFILKNFHKLLFNSELREDTFLRRVVIKQNIILFKARYKGILFSYTFIKKGINKIMDSIMIFLTNVKNYLFYVIFSYILIFFVYINISEFFSIKSYDYNGVFYFLIVIFLYLVLSISRNLIFISINFVFLIFIIIFGVINF